MKKLSNLPFLLLVIYVIKSFIVEPSLFDFGIISLMSCLFLYTMKLNKDILSDKEKLVSIIAQMEQKINEKIDNVQTTQDKDRLAYESKFSTLNLGIQRQSPQKQEKGQYGWGNR